VKNIFALLLFLFSLKSGAQIPFRLPAIFSNHAVLQQSAEVKLWGWGPGSSKVRLFPIGLNISLKTHATR
jgi:hypothetical protein